MSRLKPLILVHSATTADLIEASLGEPEYSYYFVLKSFMPVLQRLGDVHIINDPLAEVDPIYHEARQQGRYCVFLNFCPPQLQELDLNCPSMPVFAWEFETIPNEVWENDLRQDWRYSLGRMGWAVTHSSHTVANVQKAVRANFPIVSAPAPLWDQYSRLAAGRRGVGIQEAATLRIENGYLIDTGELCLQDFSLENSEDALSRACLALPAKITVNGVIYTSVFNPADGRKNWPDMVWTFCWAFKNNPDATLILKLTNNAPEDMLEVLLHDLYKLTPFKCRIIVISGFLADSDYENLAQCTTYAVNTSRGEGQCLPLMEYMSSGAPALTPRHTGLLDYVNEENSFVAQSSLEPSHWPQDPRQYYRTMRHRLDWESMLNAYKASYTAVTEHPATYSKMSAKAVKDLKAHCSQAVVTETLRAFLQRHEQQLAWFDSSETHTPTRRFKLFGS